MAVSVNVDGKQILVSDQERRKLNRRKIKPLKKKLKGNGLQVGSKIRYIGPKHTGYALYEGKIIEEFEDNTFKVSVIGVRDKVKEENIIERKRLRLCK